MEKSKLNILLNNIDPEFRDSLLFTLERRFNHIGKYFAFPISRKKCFNLIKYLVLFTKYIFFFSLFRSDSKTKYTLCATNLLVDKLDNHVVKYTYTIKSSSKLFWGTPKLLFYHFYVTYILENASMYYINSKKFQNIYNRYIFEINKNLDNCTDIIVDQDMNFFENILLLVAKRKGIITHLYFHGLKAWYNDFDENRSDYLYVWGEKMKMNYLQNGFSPIRIKSIGHPTLKITDNELIKFDTRNVLVLSKPINGANPSYSEYYTSTYNCVVYLLEIECALKKIGIKSATLRIHPSENINWYKTKLSCFWMFSSNTLDYDLTHSTICIGPTSTMLLNSIANNLNYIAYEHSENGMEDIHHMPLVPPFDKTDMRLPIAFNIEELIGILDRKQVVDKSIFQDYINAKFNIRELGLMS